MTIAGPRWLPSGVAPEVSEFVALGGVVLLGVSALIPSDEIAHGPIICPFRLVTGLPCPGCGLTRSWVYGMHGSVRESVMANPFGIPLAAALVALVLCVIAARLSDRPAPSIDRAFRNPVALVALASWLVFGAVRMVLAMGQSVGI